MSPGFIPAEEIESAAIDFLLQHHPDGSIPIPIDEIIELELKIKIIPIPKLGSFGIDGLSNHEFTEIHIDDYQFSNSENRARLRWLMKLGILCYTKPMWTRRNLKMRTNGKNLF